MKIKKNTNAEISMPFNWIFAIIAGVVILFLAIFITGKIGGMFDVTSSAETGSVLIALFNPLETGISSGKSQEISFKNDFKIILDCNSYDNRPFGLQTLRYFEKKSNNKYSDESLELPIKNKYIFSEEIIEGNNIYLFSKPVYFPYKIADATIITSLKYCFFNPPENIKEDLSGLNPNNIVVSENIKNCSGKIVCFDISNNDCDIIVYTNDKIVAKENYRVSYVDSLIYAAIFSSKENYECNLKRLINKFNELSLIYLDKMKIAKNSECKYYNLEPEIFQLMNTVKNLSDSLQLPYIEENLERIYRLNQLLFEGCKLF
jgi:hypothetical protein